MKIAVVSDLHLEFADINITNDESADVLILGGDIMLAEDLHSHPEPINTNIPLGSRQQMAIRFRDFLKRCSFQFPHVIYVAGNHEFYHGRWLASIDHLRQECAAFHNVYFLERDSKKIDDVLFMGGTLWTDCNKGDPITLHSLTGMMNDFKVIRNDEHGYTKLRPAHAMYRHKQTLEYFKTILDDNKDTKCVVVGHHSPSLKSISEEYINETLMNGGYHSDLSDFILDHPQIKLWTHGHTHYPFDYMIGDTRIFCNPRGYSGWDRNADFFEVKYVDV